MEAESQVGLAARTALGKRPWLVWLRVFLRCRNSLHHTSRLRVESSHHLRERRASFVGKAAESGPFSNLCACDERKCHMWRRQVRNPERDGLPKAIVLLAQRRWSPQGMLELGQPTTSWTVLLDIVAGFDRDASVVLLRKQEQNCIQSLVVVANGRVSRVLLRSLCHVVCPRLPRLRFTDSSETVKTCGRVGVNFPSRRTLTTLIARMDVVC